LYTPEIGVLIGLLGARSGGTTISSRASKRVVIVFVPFPGTSICTPFHQDIFVDLVIKLSPFQPEIGKKGTDLSTNSFFHPTLVRTLAISSFTSVYLASLYPARSQSILLTPIIICLIPNKLIKREC
jgi:hypothetical protein